MTDTEDLLIDLEALHSKLQEVDWYTEMKQVRRAIDWIEAHDEMLTVRRENRRLKDKLRVNEAATASLQRQVRVLQLERER